MPRAADALGHEQPIPPLSSSITEANAIVSALQNASSKLHERLNQQRLLARELNHRVKNVLAVVQAIVRRTLADRRMADARELIDQRLQALSRAQDLLMRTDWKDVSLKEIMTAELGPFSDRVTLAGPDLRISGRNVQTLTLLVHELTTNAVKYGALSDENGKVSVSWSAFDEPNGRFRFRWEERDGPPIRPPKHKGFGTTLLEGAFPELEAKRRLAYEAHGLTYELEVRLAALTEPQSST
jgi:two-component sensor histidine kinase